MAQTVSGPVTAARMEPAVTMTTRAVCVPRGGRDSSVTRPAHWYPDYIACTCFMDTSIT